MSKLLLGLLLVSTNILAGNYEVAEKQLEMCKMMGDVAIHGYKAKKSGIDRSAVASKEVTNKYGPDLQEAMLNGYDSNASTETKAKQVGFSLCMDKYAKLR